MYSDLSGSPTLPLHLHLTHQMSISNLSRRTLAVPNPKLVILILPKLALGKCGPEEGEGYQVPVYPMSLATHVLSRCPHIHPDEQLLTRGGPTIPLICSIVPGTMVEILHGVLHHVYPSVFYL